MTTAPPAVSALRRRRLFIFVRRRGRGDLVCIGQLLEDECQLRRD